MIPYFGLRSYTDGGEHYAGQIGSEPTPAAFVDALLAATREMVRVLKPAGSIWVNLGDKYDNGTTAARTNPGTIKDGTGQGYYLASPRVSLGRAKSLIGIPWRYALRCIDTTAGVPVHIVREMVAAVYNGNLDPRACDEILREYENGGRNAGLGLILRAEIIWSKPNGLPESVTDRVRRSHEQWFHMVTQPRYFSAVDEIREPHARLWDERNGGTYSKASRREDPSRGSAYTHRGSTPYPMPNPLGALPGSVWTIPTQPLRVPPDLGVDHFAAFPMEWPRRIIQGWSPAGICTGCGEGRRPVVQRDYTDRNQRGLVKYADGGGDGFTAATGWTSMPDKQLASTITGYACACPEPTAPTRPSVILDPFGGTGTTALVAKALGRHGISIDLSQDYCRLAQWRTSDPGQLAAALQIEKPETISDDQLSLLDYAAEVS